MKLSVQQIECGTSALVSCQTCAKPHRVNAWRLRHGRGRFCSKGCADRAKAHGIPSPGAFMASTHIEGDCWVWSGPRFTDFGYGRVRVNGREIHAHRCAHELFIGPIPDGLEVLHKCDNPPCVNPAHLYSGTQQQNMDDKVRRGRAATADRNGKRTCPEKVQRGADHWKARLSEESVRAIRTRRAAGETLAMLGHEFGISKTHVSRLARGVGWKHVA